MKKNIYALLILIFAKGLLVSQSETRNWYFGNGAGFSFTPAVQTQSNSAMTSNAEGCSTISDAFGNLLFYTNGNDVWDKTHAPMANGTGLAGDGNATQSCLIVKRPGSNTLYYIFTLPADGSGNFCYSVVDMSLSSGNGSVTIKNTVLSGNVTEKLTAVHHCNGTDIWVTIHELGNNTFKSYSVTAAGVSTAAVVSNVGPVQNEPRGYMKFNNAGTRLACARDTVIQTTPTFLGKAYLDLFTFNNQTGVISSPTVVLLNNWQKSYGLEFSPNNSKVYITRYDISGINGGNSEIVQFDMTAANIAASSATVASLNQELVRALQLGPDGVIYVAKGSTQFICTLSNPNAAAASVTYLDNAIDVDQAFQGNLVMLGLPNFYTSYFNAAYPAIATCTTSTNTSVYVNTNTEMFPKPYFDNMHDELAINTDLAQEGNYTITVTDISGRVVYDGKIEVSSGANNTPIQLSHLLPGVYVTKIFNGRNTVSTKFVKQ